MASARNKVIVLCLTTFVGLVASAIVGYIALDHNPMEEYCVYIVQNSVCEIVWSSLLPLLATWFIIGTVLGLIISLLVVFVLKQKDKR